MIAAASSLAPTRGAGLVWRVVAAGLRPDRRQSVSSWAAENRFVPVENSQFPGRWSNDTAPYLTEMMDCCGADHPAERVTFLKSAQVGYSEALTNVIGAMIALSPGPALMVAPTVEAGKNWVAEKLDMSIAATPALRAKVRTIVTRDGEGSTSKRKRYAGGFLIVTGANSTRELRQRSVRWLFKDDWSDWPADVNGQGDPDSMAEARTLGFQSSGQTKAVQGSTPTIKGACRTTAAYEQSDRRVFKVPCPACDWFQELRFFPDQDGRGGLRFETDGSPVAAWYSCEACGEKIEHRHKRAMVARGRWEATNPAGTHPGFHIWAAYSPFTTWDRIAQRWLSAQADVAKLKAFYNLDLGLAFEERGEAPAWEGLQKRAEDYPPGRLPHGALLVTVGCDVQGNGIYYEVVAWGPNRESWSIAAGFLAGETADRSSDAWLALDAVYRTRYPLEGGEPVPADVFAVDANFNTDQVCDWVRARPNTIAVRGVEGWDRVVFGQPSKTDRNFRGDKKKRSAKIWPVFVWSLKGELYAHLRKVPEPGAETVPPGFCHFPAAHPAAWYQQLTADYLKETERRGRVRLEWTSRGANHWHDCRIYAMAAYHRAAQKFGVLENNAAAWAAVAATRRPARPQGELALDAAAPVSAPAAPVPAAPAPVVATAASVPRRPAVSGWRRPRGYVGRW